MIKNRNTGRTWFKKGREPWNKGKKDVYTEEQRMACGNGSRGKASPMKGRKHTEESKKNISESLSVSMIGNTNTKGKPWSNARWRAYYNRMLNNFGRIFSNKGKKYHPMWNELRKVIFKRDNYTCKDCGEMKVKETKTGYTVNANCHHIDGDIENNSFDNLVTLCSECHGIRHRGAKYKKRKVINY